MKYRKDLSAKKLISGDESAVAELIGALLLTAVIAVVIGMLALVVFSGTSAVETPALRVSTVDGYGNINLIHQGGDTLSREKTQILVDGVDRTDDFETPEGDPWITFSVGDILESSIPCTEGTVIQVISNDSRNPTVIESLTCGPGIPAPVANFTFTPASGYISQMFSFTDLSTGNPDFWEWDFGDGSSTSTERNPTHRYANASTYEIKLTSCNEGGCNSTTKMLTVFDFSDFIVNESVFVYGTKLDFNGDTIVGENSTVIITGDLLSGDLNGGAKIYVSNIYVNGSVSLSGSQYLGSTTLPGLIYITGDLDLSGDARVYGYNIYVGDGVSLSNSAAVYGDLYTIGDLYINNGNLYGEAHINGDFTLRNGHVYDNVYVDGDVTILGSPIIEGYINYTGSLSPSGYSRCNHVDSVPEFSMPVFLDIPIPSVKPDEWYDTHGYVSGGGDLMEGIRIFSISDYSATQQWYYGSNNATNIVIVSKEGNITLNSFWSTPVTGVLFAPNGKVTFSGSSFEGLVIAKEGLYIPSGSTDVEFVNIDEYINDSDDYPF